MARSPRMRRFFEGQVSHFGVKAPKELVPAEHFAGTDVLRRRFALYGEAFDLGDDIDPLGS